MKKIESLQKKVISGIDLERWLTVARFKKQKIAFATGSFDLLHQGHVTFLAEAAGRGDLLVVALESDVAVRANKGDKRPVLDQDARALVLSALYFVSAIVLVDTEELPDLVRRVNPDALVMSTDGENPSVASLVKELGGEVITLDDAEGYSTADMADRITT